MNKHLLLPFILFYFLTGWNVFAQIEYEPTKENLDNREWFQDAKFGLFVHWGPYSVLGVHEWVMETEKIDKTTYENLGSFFNPTEFDPSEWVTMAKNAGMKYITITAKHHDGFAMYDSKLTHWDIVDRSPYGKDILKQLAEECHKEGIKLFFYYSQLDWNHNDYYPRGDTGQNTNRPDSGSWDNYIDYMNGQLTELLTNYGDISGIWFDGWWDKPDANWRLNETNQLIHELQPGAMIGSNHHLSPKPGEDFQMFEKDLPGHNTAGYSSEAKIGSLPLETAETMAERWGYSLQDKNFKSSDDLIRYLVKAAGYNSNFLLNVGPMPNGKIQTEYIDTLKVVGKWTDKYGESIYGTRGGPIAPQVWGVTTQKNSKVYVHILNWQDENFLLPKLDHDIKTISSFDSQQDVNYQQTEMGTLISLPEEGRNSVDQILVVTLNK